MFEREHTSHSGFISSFSIVAFTYKGYNKQGESSKYMVSLLLKYCTKGFQWLVLLNETSLKLCFTSETLRCKVKRKFVFNVITCWYLLHLKSLKCNQPVRLKYWVSAEKESLSALGKYSQSVDIAECDLLSPLKSSQLEEQRIDFDNEQKCLYLWFRNVYEFSKNAKK